jgi:hypothetical protein
MIANHAFAFFLEDDFCDIDYRPESVVVIAVCFDICIFFDKIVVVARQTDKMPIAKRYSQTTMDIFISKWSERMYRRALYNLEQILIVLSYLASRINVSHGLLHLLFCHDKLRANH